MAQHNIRDIREVIFASLSDKNLGRALAQMKILTAAARMQEIGEIENIYRTMLGYMFEGVNDPDRDAVYNNLIKKSYELADDICADFMAVNYSRNETFSTLWSAFRYGDEQLSFCKKVNAEGSELEGQIAASAVMLSCLRIFDETKMECLIELCSGPKRLSRLRAMTGLVLCLIKHDSRLSYYPAVANKLNLLFLNAKNVELAREIILQFIRCKETETITRDIKDNIIPTLTKFGEQIRDRIDDSKPKSFDSDDFEAEYKFQDLIEESGISGKLQQYSDLQMQGSDINMSTFSQLKNFPFFQDIDSWFMPFYKENPAVSTLFEQRAPKFAEVLIDNNLLCDSDKYSFCLNLLRIPEQMREQAFSQFSTGMEQAAASDERQSDSLYLNNYMHDVYRFFKLFRDRDRFDDIFALPGNVHEMDLFRFVDPDGTFLPRLAKFYFDKKQYENALSAYRLLSEAYEVNEADALLHIAFSAEKLGKFETAIENYERLRSSGSDDVFLSKQLAYCNKKLGRYDRALECYEQVLNEEPENLNMLFNKGMCLTMLKRFKEGLNTFYKIEYYNPDMAAAGRFNLYFAHCLWAAGKKKDAVAHYLRYGREGLEEALTTSPLTLSREERHWILDYCRYFG